MTHTTKTLCAPLEDSIAAIIALLDHRLHHAAETAREALHAFECDTRNMAIGTLLPLTEELKLATALLEAIFTLHRLPSLKIGGGR